MALDTYTAACGCIWYGEEHAHRCVLWRKLAARLELLRGQPDAEQEIQKVEEQMGHHRRP